MNTNLIRRRDEWLELSQEDFDQLNTLYGDYLSTQIKRYGEYKFAKSRQHELEFERNRQLGKWLKYIVYASLTGLGLTIFTVLPSIIAEQTGASDFIADIARSIGGVILVFLGHWTISLLIKEILLHVQYRTIIEEIDVKFKSNNYVKYPLKLIFIESQKDYLKTVESPFCRPPNLFSISFALLASLAEVGGLIFIFTKDTSTPNILLIIILSVVPLFLLWALSFLSAYFKEIPEIVKEIIGVHIEKLEEINKNYEQQDYFTSGDYEDSCYLSKMQECWSNEIEKKESIINYLLMRLRLSDSRGNELILVEGEIKYYSDLKTILENHKNDMKRNLLKQNKTEIKDVRLDYIKPTGEGGIQYQAEQDKSIKDEIQNRNQSLDQDRADEIISQCTIRVAELKENLIDLQSRFSS